MTKIKTLPLSDIISLLNRKAIDAKTILESPGLITQLERYDMFVRLDFIEKLEINQHSKRVVIEETLSAEGKQTMIALLFIYGNLKKL